MPLIDVTYDQGVSDDELRHLGMLLPDLVAEAVECPEEPWIGPFGPGDIEVRFHRRSEFDVGEPLRCVVEVRTKLFESRVVNKQERADLLCNRLSQAMCGGVGVWLILAEGAWAQVEEK